MPAAIFEDQEAAPRIPESMKIWNEISKPSPKPSPAKSNLSRNEPAYKLPEKKSEASPIERLKTPL